MVLVELTFGRSVAICPLCVCIVRTVSTPKLTLAGTDKGSNQKDTHDNKIIIIEGT